MSAPDIETLRALSKAHTDAWNAVFATKDALLDAVESVLLGTFGDRRGENRGERAWNVRGAWAGVEFDRSAGLWLACAGAPVDGPYVHADTPTAAVRQALDALAETHPTEAELLRKAVTFKEAP